LNVSFIESAKWPEKLTGRVAQLEPEARVQGYDVERDLARHYRMPDLVLLTLTGELPSEAAARAFEIALCFLAPMPVSEGPSHCAVIAQAVGSPPSGVIGTAAVAAAEQARYTVERHRDLLQWLAGASTQPPIAGVAPSERESAARLHEMVAEAGLDVPALAQPLGREAALIAVLFACGLTREDQLQTALVMARLPCALAEGFAARHGRLKDYPTTTPEFEHAFEP
jgi:hypothetical protein